MSKQIGVINEIGDMGLGFTAIPEKEQKVLKEQAKNEEERGKEGSRG